MCLQSHYHKQVVFPFDNLDFTFSAYKKLINKINSIVSEGSLDEEKFNFFNEKFKSYLSDDLNTANAVSVIYEVIKDEVNGYTKIELIKNFDKVLSLNLIQTKETSISDNHEYIMAKIEERNIAKQNKDYALADQIREDLLKMNIVLKDTREGTIYEVK